MDEFKLEVKDPRKTYFIIAILLLVAAGAFGLGRLSKIEEGRVPIEFSQWEVAPVNQQVLGISSEPLQTTNYNLQTGKYVGSRNSDKYHFPWCPGAQRITEGNKVWFESKEAAMAAGYTPAANCKGL